MWHCYSDFEYNSYQYPRTLRNWLGKTLR